MIYLDTSELKKLAIGRGLSPLEYDKAIKTTGRKVSRWLSTQARRDASKKLGIRQKLLARRFLPGFESKGGGIWIGIKPITLKNLNKRQQRVVIQSHEQETGNKSFLLMNQKIQSQALFIRKGKRRFPIYKIADTRIGEVTQEWVNRMRASRDSERQFYKIFEQQMNWQQSL